MNSLGSTRMRQRLSMVEHGKAKPSTGLLAKLA